jgi:hypothetical protein
MVVFMAIHTVMKARTPITTIDSDPKAASVKPRLEYAGTMLVELSVMELVIV